MYARRRPTSITESLKRILLFILKLFLICFRDESDNCILWSSLEYQLKAIRRKVPAVPHSHQRQNLVLFIPLYDKLLSLQHVKSEGDPYGIQAWTASMWAELWTGWKLGHSVVVPPEFDFCWATCPSSRWEEVYFFHNAGVPSSDQGMFYKANYMDKYPFNEKLELSDSRCSYNYYKLIESVDSCLI